MLVERNGAIQKWTFYEGYQEALSFAKSLHAIGCTERKCVNIMGFNSPEWIIAYHGSIFFNDYVTGVYITNQAEACLYQAEHSEAEVIVVDTVAQLKKYYGNLHKLPQVKAIVVWMEDAIPKEYNDKRIMLWRDFMKLGKSVEDGIINDKINKQAPGMCCTLVYTSGTTGNPKGVMLSHDNLTWALIPFFNDGQKELPFGPDDRLVSYLPLSHIAGLAVDVVAQMLHGNTVYFARPDALQGTLTQTLQWARPTLFFAVPRVWEKFEEKMKDIASQKPAIVQNISGWAKGLGTAKVHADLK